jgi:hypothetical protein
MWPNQLQYRGYGFIIDPSDTKTNHLPRRDHLSAMRRPSKDSSHKLSAESQRLSSIAQAIVQTASRVEERTWERQLDAHLQKLLKTNHQESIDAALNALFKDDLQPTTC